MLICQNSDMTSVHTLILLIRRMKKLNNNNVTISQFAVGIFFTEKTSLSLLSSLAKTSLNSHVSLGIELIAEDEK